MPGERKNMDGDDGGDRGIKERFPHPCRRNCPQF